VPAAELPPEEQTRLYRRHRKLRLMRGEEPLSFEDWNAARIAGNTAEGTSADRSALDPSGRGLWRRTKLEDIFEDLSSMPDRPADDAIPQLATPGEVGERASNTAETKRVDVSGWAKKLLKEEIKRACASDRSLAFQPGGCRFNGNLRVDAVIGRDTQATPVELGDGKCIVTLPDQSHTLMCGYGFRNCKAHYTVSVLQRPASGAGQAEAFLYVGLVEIDELRSGLLPDYDAFEPHVRISEPQPRPSDEHAAAIRPVLRRLRRSCAYFVRRFERILLQGALMEMKREGRDETASARGSTEAPPS